MDRRAIWHILANITAVVIFIIGIMSPLTPSQGLPQPIDIFIFAAIPVCVLAYCGLVSRNKIAKLLFLLETVVLAGIFCYLLVSILKA